MAAQAQTHGQELAAGGDVGSGKGGEHRRLRRLRRALPDGDDVEDEDQGGADDVGRAQRRDRPAMGARGAVEHIAKRDHRQDEQAEEDRQGVIGLDGRAHQTDHEIADQRQGARREHGEDTRRRRQAANFGERPVAAILRQEADDGGMKAEAGEIAEQDDHHPDEDEDAVFEFAHDAGLDDLRDEGDGRADDANDEGSERHALGGGLLVVAGQGRADPADKRHDRAAQPRRQ